MARPLVRQLAPLDIPGVVALQRDCFPAPFPEDLLWNAEHLERHLQVFPQGQLVAVFSDEVVGSASSLLVSEGSWRAHKDWETTVGGHFLAAHEPEGSTLYGVDISVHPAWRGQGVGRALYEERFDLVRKLGLARFGTGCRLPGFGQSGFASVEEYVSAVIRGGAFDRTLTPLLRYGLNCIGVIHDYMEDEESANAAALLEWTP